MIFDIIIAIFAFVLCDLLILLLLARFLPQKYTYYIVRIILKVFLFWKRYKVYGNINAQLIAANHESMIETFIFMVLFKNPCFIYKKELNNIFIFGKIIQKLDMIPIDRHNSSREQIEQINILAHNAILNKRTVVIFPQGSRIKNGQYKKFKKGVIHLSNILNIPITSVALKHISFSCTKMYIIEKKFYASIEELEKTILNIYNNIS